jgi:hypothetical protein
VALHPEQAKSKVKKEIMVLAEMERRCPDIYERANERVWDCRVEGGCSLRRPDMLLDFGTWAVIIEVDESYHDEKSCWDEETRLNIIAADIQLPVAVLRLKVDTPVACFSFKKLGNGERVLNAKQQPFNGLMQRAEDWLRNTVACFGGSVPPPPVAFLDDVTLTGEETPSSMSSSSTAPRGPAPAREW